MPALAKIHDLGIQSVSNSAAQGAQQLNEYALTIESRLSAMKALKLPENSEQEAVREQFVADAESAYEKLADTIDKVNAAING